MSRLENSENSNEWINWIEEAISRKLIKYYEYEHFRDFKEIGSGSFGKVYRASWRGPHRYLALKSFSNNDNAVKEIVHEVIMNNNFFNFIFIACIYSTSNFKIYLSFSLNSSAMLIFMRILFVSMVLQST